MWKRWKRPILFAVLLVVLWTAQLVNRARQDRVSLDFNEADLAKVVHAMERQTRETILVQPGVTKKITIQARNVPLEHALEMISFRAECEWAAVFAVYRQGESIKQLEKRIVTGKSEPGVWTHYPASSFRRPGSMPFGEDNGGLIDYATERKEAARVASDLSRFGKAVVVIADGLTGTVQLALNDASIDLAVEFLAQALHAKFERFYVLRPFFREQNRPPMPPPALQTRALPDDLRKAFESGKPVQIQFDPKEGEKLEFPPEDLLAQPPLDPAEEQKKIQQKTVDDIRHTTPEQRLERLRQTQKTP